MEAEQRESMIRRWFEMWLLGRDLGIARLFSPDARYIESWGPHIRVWSGFNTGLRNGIPAESGGVDDPAIFS